MAIISVSDKETNTGNVRYIVNSLGEVFLHARCEISEKKVGARELLTVNCPDIYFDIVSAEINDKIAEVIAVNYKYVFFKDRLKVSGLSKAETEILFASLIAADFEEDKKYSFDRLKNLSEIAIDGIYNFRLQPLKKKWEDVVSYIPTGFINTQLKEFIGYLLENKKRRVFIDGGKVYDWHYRRLKRASLLGGEDLSIIKEVLLSNCGEIEISGKIPESDEYYIKEFYGDKIYFS